MEVQMMKSVAQTVTPVHKYYYEPVSGKKFWSMPEVLRFLKTGSMRKKSTGGDATILGHLLFMETWFLKAKDKNGMLSSRLCPKGMQIGMQVSLMCYNQLKNVSRDLIVVDGFLLWRRNRQKVLHLNSVHDVQVWSVIGVVEPVNLKHFTKMDISEKLSQVRAMEAVTNACIGVGCLYYTISGVAHEV
ncbi:hypothetical protein T459_34636 [Capsicum annuum]|uniref:MBD domain-containing protein n=1 Tax=Capsicum annuum TaxID=4072 RepID=A0A2G2XVQ5_CAPAN|nr:hypothetical protein T459_34636 [Capsicum annuum]